MNHETEHDNGLTLLHHAAKLNAIRDIKRIWERMGPRVSINDFNPRDSKGRTPLIFASKVVSVSTIKLFWDKMGLDATVDDLNPKDNNGCSLLNYATVWNRLDIIELIFEKIGEAESSNQLKQKMIDGRTPLFFSVHSKGLQIIRAMYDKMHCPNLEEINPSLRNGYTLLHYAAEHKRVDIIQEIWIEMEKIEPNLTLEQFNPKDSLGNTLLHIAACEEGGPIIEEIWKKIGRTYRVEYINPPNNEGVTPLFDAIEKDAHSIVEKIYNKIGMTGTIEQLNPKKADGRTPLHLSALNNQIKYVQMILDRMGANASIDQINPRDASGLTPLVLAGSVDIVKTIWNRMGPDAPLSQLIPKDNKGNSLLHYAAYNKRINIIKLILNKLGHTESVSQLIQMNSSHITPFYYAFIHDAPELFHAMYEQTDPFDLNEINLKIFNKYTLLHCAAWEGRLYAIDAIIKKMGTNVCISNMNPRGDNLETPLFLACSRSKFDAIHNLLGNELVEINNIGPQNLFNVLKGDNPESNAVRSRLRMLGCLEPQTLKVINLNKVRDVHAPDVKNKIAISLDKLRFGKTMEEVLDSYNAFVRYCDLSNSEYVQDIQALKANSQNFSRELIVNAFSINNNISVSDVMRLENLKLQTFHEAILKRIHTMTLHSNSSDFIFSFKERIGLIWIEINNRKYWHKFTDLKEIIEVKLDSKDNQSSGLSDSQNIGEQVDGSKLNAVLQNLRNTLFASLVESQFEYPQSNTDGGPSGFYDLLMQSKPSCVAGTNERIIECFSFKHIDIEIVNGNFTPDFDKNAPIQSRITSKLYDLIIASAHIRTDEITGIELIQELLDRMASVSDKVRGIPPENHLLLEEQMRSYFKMGSVPGHSRAIGYYLGFLKHTLLINLDIIGHMQIQQNGNQEQALSDAFKHLEYALANTQPGFFTQSLTDAKKAYYQSFFSENIEDWKFEHLIKIVNNEDNKFCDERILIKSIIVDKFTKANEDIIKNQNDAGYKCKSDTAVFKNIKESDWYLQFKKHVQQVTHCNEGNVKAYDVMMLKFNEMIGAKSSDIHSRFIEDLPRSDYEDSDYEQGLSRPLLILRHTSTEPINSRMDNGQIGQNTHNQGIEHANDSDIKIRKPSRSCSMS